MDWLCHIIDKVSAQQFTQIDHILPSNMVVPLDNNLVQPWLKAWEHSEDLSKCGEPGMSKEMWRIKVHVEAVYEEHMAIIKTYSSKPQHGSSSFTELPMEKRQDALCVLSQIFHTALTGLKCFKPSTH